MEPQLHPGNGPALAMSLPSSVGCPQSRMQKMNKER